MKKRYPESAWERAMKELEVVLRAIDGKIKWIQAADILDVSPRTMRRKYYEYREHGVDGLMDRRRGSPSPRKAPYDVVELVLKLYRDSYHDFNVQHFHEKLVEDHGITYSYSWVKNLLQEAGCVKRGKGRGGHRQRRERRKLFGQMLHLDGSDHPWLSLRPHERQTLLLVVDDATGRNLAGRLFDAESTKNCLRIMREVVEKYGICSQIYTDRHSVYWNTIKGARRVDKDNLTQFGRAMEELGIEMIPGYSPQARGRGERWNGTWQGRLVSELRLEGIDNIDEANRYIEEVFIPDMNRRFSVEAKNPQSAFISAAGIDLDRIFAIVYPGRKVAADNTVRANAMIFQIEASPYRASFTKCSVDVFEHLDGNYSVVWKGRTIGRYDCEAATLGGSAPKPPKFSALETREEKKRRKSIAAASSPVNRKRSGRSSPEPYPPAIY